MTIFKQKETTEKGMIALNNLFSFLSFKKKKKLYSSVFVFILYYY
jgi:hypothetical protein